MLDILLCMLKGGHRYGHWWWPTRPEAADGAAAVLAVMHDLADK